MLAAIAIASQLQVGDLATFKWPGTDARTCARVSLLDRGPGDVPHAWLIVIEGPPHAIAHMPLLELEPGCAPK
jgi:hypothetical protein